MSIGWKKVVLGTLAALALGGAAQASEVSITIRTNDRLPHRVADYDGDLFERRQYSRTEHGYEHRDPDRYYGRPVPEWRERKHRHGEYRSIPVVDRHEWHQPVYARPHWRHQGGCKIIINERVNRWGERVQVRKEICR
ncbi:hypothetical protein [Microvirga sp. BSC39]|uniref:hypothetical protein n=1 Tax=Microvirga sp. BSC39 TaxID=1549810 RepID=UPI001269BA57|nr:hypothetical protein [Microvirga sp. BSC39]